jgi:hypothetical protein
LALTDSHPIFSGLFALSFIAFRFISQRHLSAQCLTSFSRGPRGHVSTFNNRLDAAGDPPFLRVLADPWSAGSKLIWPEKIFSGCDSIHTVNIEILRNPKHGGTELELAGLQLDGERF